MRGVTQKNGTVSSPQNEHHRALIDLSFSNEPRLAALATSIVNSPWFKTGAMEPVVETTDEVVRDKIVRPGESRFRAFLEMTPTRTYKCQFTTEHGPCERTEERLDRAQGHARQHLDYRPYVCGGKCARPDWYVSSPSKRPSSSLRFWYQHPAVLFLWSKG